MERVKGIEPSSQAWEARILPLNHTRFRYATARQARLDTNITPACRVVAHRAKTDGQARLLQTCVGAATRLCAPRQSDCFYQTGRRLATALRKRLWVSLMKDGGEK